MTGSTTHNGHCQYTREQIHPYLTGRLESEAREAYALHLQDCSDCTGYVAFMDHAIHLECRDLVELVTDYLEGQLPPAERARLEAHLQLCKGCRQYLEQMRETIRLTGSLREDAIPPAGKADLLAVFRNWKRG